MAPAEALAARPRRPLTREQTERTRPHPRKLAFTREAVEAMAAEAAEAPGIVGTVFNIITTTPATAAKDRKAAKAPTALSSYMFRRKTWLNIKVH